MAYHRLGAGPPVVAVHGGLGTWRSWQRVAERLAGRFEFFLIDRRGRGDSGDADEHSLQREVDDVRAVLDHAGPGAAVIGHSYGGALALESARHGAVAAVAVYEPAVSIGSLISPAEIARIEQLLAHGELDAALALLDGSGLVTTMKLPPAITATACSARAHPHDRARARAIADLGPERYRQLALPTLVLIGTNSPPPQREACERLAATLPDARVAWLEGLGHVAHTGAPDEVAAVLRPFLTTHLDLGSR